MIAPWDGGTDWEATLYEVLTWVEAYPGYWTAALCRLINGLTAPWQELPPPTPQWYPDYAPPTAATKAHVNRQVMYCGLCRDYSGLRKRKRAAQLPPPLPGLEAHAAYLLHAPCGPIGLKTLQRALRQLELDIVAVRGIPHELIPDPRNHRGWDYATCWWPND